MSKNQFTGTATQPQRNRKCCQFNKDQYCTPWCPPSSLSRRLVYYSCIHYMCWCVVCSRDHTDIVQESLLLLPDCYSIVSAMYTVKGKGILLFNSLRVLLNGVLQWMRSHYVCRWTSTLTSRWTTISCLSCISPGDGLITLTFTTCAAIWCFTEEEITLRLSEDQYFDFLTSHCHCIVSAMYNVQ